MRETKPKREPKQIALDDKNPWMIEEYGGHPITPRVVGEEEDFARIGLQSFLLEPACWLFAGYVLHGTAWRSPKDIMGYWMVLFVMLPLRLLDTDKKRDWPFRVQYVLLQLLALAAGYLGWRLAGGSTVLAG